MIMIREKMPDYYCSVCGRTIEPHENYYQGCRNDTYCIECADKI